MQGRRLLTDQLCLFFACRLFSTNPPFYGLCPIFRFGTLLPVTGPHNRRPLTHAVQPRRFPPFRVPGPGLPLRDTRRAPSLMCTTVHNGHSIAFAAPPAQSAQSSSCIYTTHTHTRTRRTLAYTPLRPYRASLSSASLPSPLRVPLPPARPFRPPHAFWKENRETRK